MKYIKNFEDVKNPDLEQLLYNFLNKMKSGNCSVSRTYERKFGYVLAFMTKYKFSISSNHIVFTIRILPVSDKKLRDELVKPKFKLILNCCYDNSEITDKELVNNLIDFLTDTFKKYSYFNKKNYCYNSWRYNSWRPVTENNYDFYINTSNIENIMNELNNDFEIYQDSKRYNL